MVLVCDRSERVGFDGNLTSELLPMQFCRGQIFTKQE
jgi:hypothetical protein